MSSAEKSRYCGKCGCQVSAEDNFCPFCGANISSKVTCNVCGAVNPRGQAFCRNCGTSLTAEAFESPKKKTPPKAAAAERLNITEHKTTENFSKALNIWKLLTFFLATILLLTIVIIAVQLIESKRQNESEVIAHEEASVSDDKTTTLEEEPDNELVPVLHTELPTEDFMFCFYCYKEDANMSYLVYEDSGEISCYVVDGYIYNVIFSADRSRVAFCTAPNDEFDEGAYLVNVGSSQGITQITGDGGLLDFSSNGKTLVYYLFDTDQEEVTLIQYDVETGKESTEVDHDLWDVILSPDGQTMLIYDVKEVENGQKRSEVYLCRNGQRTFAGSDLSPLAVSNDGCFYATNENEDIFWVDDRGNQIQIGSGDCFDSTTFNRDCSEMIYYNDEGIYFAKEGIVTPIFFADDPSIYLKIDDTVSVKKYVGPEIADVYDLETFRGQFFYSYYETGDGGYRDGPFYMYLDESLTLHELQETDYHPIISPDRSAIYYMGMERIPYDNGYGVTSEKNVWYPKVRDVSNFQLEETIIEKEVGSLFPLSDGETIYYTSDNALWKMRRGNSAEAVLMMDVYRIFETHNEQILFNLYDDAGYAQTLYFLNNDGSTEEILDGVYNVFALSCATFCEVSSDGQNYLYVSMDGKNYDLLIQGIDEIKFN